MAVAKKNEKQRNIPYVWKVRINRQTAQRRDALGRRGSVSAHLRRQGINVIKVKRLRGSTQPVTEKDISLFTRQLATMMKSGVRCFRHSTSSAKGIAMPSVARLLFDIKTDVETGSSLQQAFKKYPLYFDELYCNLIGAGEAAGILDTLLDRLALTRKKFKLSRARSNRRLFYSGFDHRGCVHHHPVIMIL